MNVKFNCSRQYLLFIAVACAWLCAATANVRAQKKIEIVKVTLKPEKTVYKGDCPVKIVFTGTITIKEADGTGTLLYGFERSDGAKSSKQSEAFFGIGEIEKKIETTWTLSKSFGGWIVVKAYEPQTNKVFASGIREGSFSVRCAAGAKP